jgi:HEAT repeat protein
MSSPAESIAELVDNLRDKDGVMRASARRHLVALGAPAVPALVELLRAPAQHVRWEAAKALEALAAPSAAPALVEALADPDSDVSWVAATALVAIGAPGVQPLLRRLAGKPAPDQPLPDAMYRGAHHVLHSLSKRTGDQRFDRLLEALGREDPELSVPVAAQELLGEATRS